MPHTRRRTVETADGVNLHVVEAGDPAAPPLVLVHGFAGSSRVWERQLVDRALTERFRVIAPDLRGHGSSQTHLEQSQMRADDMDGHARLWSQDLDAVRDGLEAPVLVGWSFGGAVLESHIYAHDGLGDAAAAVVVSAPCVLGPVPEGDAASGIAPPEAIGALIATAKGETGDFATRVLARGSGDAPAPGDLELLAEIAELCPVEVRSAMLGYAYDFRPFLAGLPESQRERMTVMITEHDQVFSSGPMHAVWEQAGVRPVSVPGEGHALAMRDPERFRELLLACLAATAPGS